MSTTTTPPAPVLSVLEDDSLYEVDFDTVLRDGFIPAATAAELWRAWCKRAGLDHRKHLIMMAVSCSAGTSAETNLEERFLEVGNSKSCVARFVDSITDDDFIAGRTNKLRVWARSMDDFAAITRKVILKNPELALARAAEYEVDVQYAGVCFDYASVLNGEAIHLTPTEREVMNYGLRFKAGEGRPAINSGQGSGVPGSAPADRGVAAAMNPRGERTLRTGGSGPFAR